MEKIISLRFAKRATRVVCMGFLSNLSLTAMNTMTAMSLVIMNSSPLSQWNHLVIGSISTVSRVRSLILSEERRLDAWAVRDAIGKLIIYASPMSREVKPVSNFLVYLTQNCIKRSRTHPNDFRNSFSVHFCTGCDMQLTFFDLRMDGKKRSKRRGSEKIKWKSLWFTRQNFQRIECSSVKYKRGRLHL